jgi:hypothetical protein
MTDGESRTKIIGPGVAMRFPKLSKCFLSTGFINLFLDRIWIYAAIIFYEKSYGSGLR